MKCINTNQLKLSLVFFVTALSGCSVMDGDYSCGKVGGVNGCTDMAEIRGNIDLYSAGQANGLNETSSSQASASSSVNVNSPFVLLPRRDRQGEPLRSKETKRQVTIFPFVDQNDIYYDTMDVFVVLEESHWSGRPVQSIKKD